MLGTQHGDLRTVYWCRQHKITIHTSFKDM